MSAPPKTPEGAPMSDSIHVPANVARLPIDPVRGMPVPYFAAWVDGQPDFRVSDKLGDAVRFNRCWVCGQPRGRYGTFVIGPMCAVNRNTAEPPCHLDCAVWAVQVCPFMLNPDRRRRDSNMPEGRSDPAGEMIRRNPGVTLLWTTRDWRPVSDGRGGILFDLGDPTAVQWWARGRVADRAEVEASIESGIPLLREIAEGEGPKAVAALERMRVAAERWLPADKARGGRRG